MYIYNVVIVPIYSRSILLKCIISSQRGVTIKTQHGRSYSICFSLYIFNMLFFTDIMKITLVSKQYIFFKDYSLPTG